MAQHDMNIANQSFPDFRTDLNNALSAINSMHSGTSRPSGAVAGTMWLDTTSASSPTIKFFDGSDDISFATIDYSGNTVNFLDSTVVADIVGDTSPQLGGQLDVNGNAIGDGTRELLKFIETASAVNEVTITNSATGNAPEFSATGDDTNIDLKLTPKGSGKLVLDGLSFPNADGSADQFLKTNGSGTLSFASASGGTDWQSSVKTANFTASAGEGYFVNTDGGAFEIDLPTSPSVGDTIEFVDFTRNFATANLTLDQGSNKFQGFTSPKPVYDVNGQSIRIVYSGSTQGWIPTTDDDVTLETPQAYSVDMLVIAGGGGGANDDGGGGGAGGYRTSTQNMSPGTVYTITIGDGGSANGSGSDTSISGSGLTTITSTGGGVGGTPGNAGGNGGSGGGGGSNSTGSGGAGGSGNTPSTSPSQGNNGGAGSSSPRTAGGGGGAGESGNTDGLGHGGDGASSSITGSAVTRAGGGGGSTRATSTPFGGGDGGGGAGGTDSPHTSAANGTANTGSGGGGGPGSDPKPGGTGGKGVVILSVPTASYSSTTSGSPTVTTSGSNTIIQFNGSGSYTA
jgi:hypothetical protein